MSRNSQALFLFFFTALLLVRQGQAQTGPLWRQAAAPAARGSEGKPGPASWFTLNALQLATRLAQAPPETRRAEAITLELPYPDGTLHRFAITRVPVLAPELAARYPQIQTYAGWARDAPATTVRLETSPTGLQAQVLTPTGTIHVLPESAAASRYQSRAGVPSDFECLVQQPSELIQRKGDPPPNPPAPYGPQLRTLRLALAATGEYSTALGGGTAEGTLASMATLVSRLNAVYERDLALRLQLVANNDRLIYLDAATDPYDNSSPRNLMDANDAVVKNALGVGNYDLGHVLGQRGGGYSGVAYVGVVCTNTASRPNNRAAGGSSTAGTLASMTTVLTHEIGHQLGSNHTFNSNKGNCGNDNRSSDTAFEPGAGNTIMSYDRRCDADNVGDGIVYFHAGSLSAIVPRLTCGTLTNTNNRPPTLTVPPSTYTIPKGTPFALAGSGSDPDGDPLTYSWEQLDRGEASGLADAATDASGPPLFRSFTPEATPERTFPKLSAILSNTTSLGEILPLVARALNFRLTARDNRGGITGANATLAVADAGPFRVRAPDAAFTAAPGSTYAVAWDVLGTNVAPVNCANVQILFSADGGQTFPTVLLASTPNDGAAQVTLPRLNTTQGRLKIQALNNVFFAINNASITIAGPPLPVELAVFRVEARQAVARFTWTTASEKNNAGFAVEASADGQIFRRLGWVEGQGTATRPNNYQFNDGTLAAYPGPVVYYRLRQVDRDGSETFSPVRDVPVPTGLASSLQLWPNPAHHTVTVAGLAPGQVVQLYDLTGRVVLTATTPPSGPLQLVLPASIPAGIYVVRGSGQSQRLALE